MSSKFKDNSKACKAAIRQAAIKGLTGSSNTVRDSAKSLVPVDTGNLRTHIVSKVNKKELEAVVGVSPEYGIYVEFGTGEFAENGQGRKGGWFYEAPDGNWYFTYGQKPRPYLRPAFRRNKNNVIKIFEKALKEIR